MPQLRQERGGLIIVLVLTAHRVRLQLIMQSRRLQALWDRHASVQHVPQVLDRSGDDAAPSRRADGIVEGSVALVLDNRAGDGGEGPLAGADVVGLRGGVTEGIRGAGHRKVVHFIVHDDSCFGNDDLRAEEGVDCCSEGNGKARCVGRDNMGCAATAAAVRRRVGFQIRSLTLRRTRDLLARSLKPVGSLHPRSCFDHLLLSFH